MSRQLGQALADAANALLAVAKAIQGEEIQPVANLSLTHPGPSAVNGVASCATVAEAINDFLVAKVRAGRSDRYVRTLRNSLAKFARGRARRLLDDVSSEEVERWLAESDWAPRTRAGYLLDVRTLYNWAKARKYCAGNPANAVDRPTDPSAVIGVHSPEEVSIVLETAREMDLNVCRCMAIRYFAGLRKSEAERLEEREIREAEGLIEVSADKSKTRRRRLVTIQPNLRAWLALGGALPLRDVSNRMRALTKEVEARGVAWPQNAPRHSFCSYHLAAFERASKTALEAGHSEAMLFGQYRALATKGDGERFFEIVPKGLSLSPTAPWEGRGL